MKVSAETSRKMRVLSFVAMVCVVMIHSQTVVAFESRPASWRVFSQMLLLAASTNWAVPFFFVISGFLFAAHMLSGKMGYCQLLCKKMRTLFVPYLLWAIIGTVITMSLSMVNNHITHRELFLRTFMDEAGIWNKVDALLGIVREGPRGNVVLWYVHSLMWIFVFSPALVAMSRVHRLALLLMGLLFAMAVPDVSIPILSLKLGSIGWFCVGMGSAQLALDRRRMLDSVFFVTGLGWGVLIAFRAMKEAGYIGSIGGMPENLAPLAALSGMLFWWGLYDRISLLRNGELPECFQMTFWVYCLHNGITGWILASVLYLLGKSEWVGMLASFLSVCVSLIFSLAVGHFMKRRFPKAYAVLTGGR